MPLLPQPVARALDSYHSFLGVCMQRAHTQESATVLPADRSQLSNLLGHAHNMLVDFERVCDIKDMYFRDSLAEHIDYMAGLCVAMGLAESAIAGGAHTLHDASPLLSHGVADNEHGDAAGPQLRSADGARTPRRRPC